MSSKTGAERTGAAARVEDPPRSERSLAWRLTIWQASAAFAVVVGTTVILYLAQVDRFEQINDEFIREHVQIARTMLIDKPNDMTTLRQQIDLEALEGIYIRVLDQDWQLLLETPRMAELLPAALFHPPAGRGEEHERARDVHGGEGKTFRALVCGAPADAGTPLTHWLVIAYDRSEEAAVLAEFRSRAIPALLLALVLCLAFGHHIARRGLRPVHEISQKMLQIHSSTLDERVALTRLPAELYELAATFNGMLDRLQGAFHRLARFSADIAHELRTPVNNLRGEMEVALGRSRTPDEYRDALGSCLEECLRLAQIIDSLLFLARAEHPETKIQREPLDLGSELRRLKEYYEPAAAERSIALAVSVPPGLTAELDKILLQRALGNLVDNALRHTPAGGSIELLARGDDGHVELGVKDTGSGIGPEDLPKVFDRFFRADPSRSTGTGQTGLGLAIVKSIAELHGGTATVTSELGRGTTVALRLRRA